MQFDIILKNDKVRSYRMITVIIVILNLLYFGYLLFDKQHRNLGMISIGTLAIYGVYRIFITRKKGIQFYIDEWVYFVLMLLWIDSYLLAVLNLLLMLLYTAATQEIRYEFSEEVTQKNFPWKKFTWSQFGNIVLKDNILTMDLRTNKIIQAEVNGEVNEKDFNAFVASKLKAD